MTQLGERFRQAREALGISITEASTATRILPRYLQAIEAGDVASLPGDVYARGFVRNYAQLLGLPAEEMVALYRQERGEPTSRITIVPAAVPPRTRSCLVPSFFVTFFTVLLLLAGLYFVLNSTGMLTPPDNTSAGGVLVEPTTPPVTPTDWATPTEPPPGTTQSPLPPAPTGTAAPPDPNQTPPPAVSASAVAPTPQAAPIVVQANVIAPAGAVGSWFTVTEDGVQAYNAIGRPGQSFTWRGQNEVFLNIGDTAVVQLTWNGQPVPGFPGTVSGVPRRLTCTPQGCS
jgi:cytoskeleton protein RodZ